MGKVREHFTDDVEGLAEWMKRKLHNHDPMSQRDTAKGQRIVAYANNSKTAVHYTTAGGRTFELSVREINTENPRVKKRVAAA